MTPEVTPEVTTEVTTEVSPLVRLVSALEGEMSRQEIMQRLVLRTKSTSAGSTLPLRLRRDSSSAPSPTSREAASSDTGSRRGDEKAASERHQSLLSGKYARNVSRYESGSAFRSFG